MLHGCVEVALLEWLHVVHLLHEVDIVLPTETTKLKLFKTLKLLLNVNSLHGISGPLHLPSRRQVPQTFATQASTFTGTELYNLTYNSWLALL